MVIYPVDSVIRLLNNPGQIVFLSLTIHQKNRSASSMKAQIPQNKESLFL